MTPEEAYERIAEGHQELLDRYEGEPKDWPIPAKLRLAALWFDVYDVKRGEFNIEDMDMQRDLRAAADLLEGI